MSPSCKTVSTAPCSPHFSGSKLDGAGPTGLHCGLTLRGAFATGTRHAADGARFEARSPLAQASLLGAGLTVVMEVLAGNENRSCHLHDAHGDCRRDHRQLGLDRRKVLCQEAAGFRQMTSRGAWPARSRRMAAYEPATAPFSQTAERSDC